MKQWFRWPLLVFLIGTALLFGGCAGKQTEILSTTVDQTPSVEEAGDIEDEQTDGQPAQEQTAVVAVYVCGQVKKPGVYELTADSRICDALAAAGGVSEKADAELINQAALVSDGMRLYVPGQEETKTLDRMSQDLTGTVSQTAGTAPGDRAGGKVNINQASREELMTLSGIGESKADSIIRYREDNGGFTKIEDIMNIRGIKEGVFEQIKDLITV